MTDNRIIIRDYILGLLDAYVPNYAYFLFNFLIILWIAISAVVLYFVFQRIVLRILTGFHFVDREGTWLHEFHKQNLLRYLLLIVQGAIAQIQVKAWLEESSLLAKILSSLSDLLILFFGLMAVFALLNAFLSIVISRTAKMQVPIRGAVQTGKLILGVLFCLIAIAIVLDKSILVLLSGIGALSAVLMLVFKDPILGLAAGIQLSVNNMLMVGDWLEMPKYSADGDVIEIGLTTVKVQNFDKTITTIPTYALISDSFKNWRGMSDAGARRIKRSFLINTASIKFLDGKDIEHLKKSNLLVSYLEEKLDDLAKENSELNSDLACMINGRRLTNIGTFRAYLISYLKAHPKIRTDDMTLMVRQLEPSKNGLPIEVYAFTNTTDWAEYESIQADIFDHIFAVLGEFKLLAHESPIGEDIKRLSPRQGGAV